MRRALWLRMSRWPRSTFGRLILSRLGVPALFLLGGSWFLTVVFAPFWWLGIPTMARIFTALYAAFVLIGILRRRWQRRWKVHTQPFTAGPTLSLLIILARRSEAARFIAAVLLALNRFAGPTFFLFSGISFALFFILLVGVATIEVAEDLGWLLLLLLMLCAWAMPPLRKAAYHYPYYFFHMLARRTRGALEQVNAASPPLQHAGSPAP
jgi:hypothetical protein